MSKIYKIFIHALPVLCMVALIPVVTNDYILTVIYIGIIILSMKIKREKGDLIVLSFGFTAMIASEYLFVSTGVEVFIRNTLFGLMPLWLPFLWAYGFVAIKRGVRVLGE